MEWNLAAPSSTLPQWNLDSRVSFERLEYEKCCIRVWASLLYIRMARIFKDLDKDGFSQKIDNFFCFWVIYKKIRQNDGQFLVKFNP